MTLCSTLLAPFKAEQEACISLESRQIMGFRVGGGGQLQAGDCEPGPVLLAT